jgi:hypothetical protein
VHTGPQVSGDPTVILLQSWCTCVSPPPWIVCNIRVQLCYDIKNTVQRELRGVKIGINRTERINCIAGKCHLPCPNGHHHESFINVFSGFSTFCHHPNWLGQKTLQRRTNSVTASALQGVAAQHLCIPKCAVKTPAVISDAVAAQCRCVSKCVVVNS